MTEKNTAVVFKASVSYDHRESPTSQFVLRKGQRPNLVIGGQYFPFEVVDDEGEIAFGETGVITGRAISTPDLDEAFVVGKAIELRSASRPLCSGGITEIVSHEDLPDRKLIK